jgi:hypothetical protein
MSESLSQAMAEASARFTDRDALNDRAGKVRTLTGA